MTDPRALCQLYVPISPTKGGARRKDFRVIKVTLSSFEDAGSQNYEWAHLLQGIVNASCIEDQMDAIKKMSCRLLEADGKAENAVIRNCIKLAADLFLTAPLKHPVKSALMKTFNSIQQHTQDEAMSCLKEGLQCRIATATRSHDLKDMTIVFSALLSYYENLKLGSQILSSMLCDILQFLEKVLHQCHLFLSGENNPMQRVEVSKATHTISRIIITVLQRTEMNIVNVSNFEKTLIEKIHKLALCVVSCSEIPLDTRTNFGFVIVLVLECLEGCNGWMQLLDSENIMSGDDMSLLCLCSGLLSGLKCEQLRLIHAEKGKSIIACILDVALFVNERSVQESNTILALWRVIQQFTRVLSSNEGLVSSLEKAQIEEFLKHLWGVLDHYMDSVKHLAESILENIMQLKEAFLSLGINLGMKMSEAFMLIPPSKRSRYVVLSTMTAHLSTSEIMEKIPNVIDNLLTAMQYPSMSSHVSGAFVAMSCADFKYLPYSKWFALWVLPLFEIMQKHSTSEFPALEETLLKTMKMCPQILMEVLADFDKEQYLDVHKLRLLLTVMKLGRRLGVVSPKKNENESLWFGVLPIDILQEAFYSQCDEIRLSALALIVESSRSTEVFSRIDFLLLKDFLKYSINCEVPSFRQQTLSFMSKMLNRIKDSAHTLKRLSKTRSPNDDRCEIVLQTYSTFLLWLLVFCFDNLQIGSNHSRRNCSLKILTFIFEILHINSFINSNDYTNQVWTARNALILIGVILSDTFEDNKAMATKLLAFSPPNIFGLNDNGKLFKLFQNGCTLASSIHPSDCISAAYLLEMCCDFYSKHSSKIVDNDKLQHLEVLDAILHLKTQLEKEAIVAEKDILLAASSGPMYGTLFCIRHMLQLIPDFRKLENLIMWQNLIKDLVELCFRVDGIVSQVVNSSSPEGHLPMDFNQELGSSLVMDSKALSTNKNPSKVTAQMVLLCSWRSVKEVSLMLGKLTDCCPILPDSKGLLSEDQIEAIGTHLTTLLEETKHRGAFEQAYVGFSLLAARLWRHPKKSLQEMPQKWLYELMDAIKSNVPTGTKLCATRRSAGVPFLVQALVTAEVQTGAGIPFLQSTMSQLLECASDKNKYVESRTHALNILRALYRHAPLAEYVAPYISDGVIVALSGFKGKTWAERNSATLLFSSLMTRIFGVRRSREELSSRNKMTGRVFFHRYPELYEFLLSELDRSVRALSTGDVTELSILHPILLLIARLYPSSLEGTDTPMQLSTFVPFVRECAGNSVLKTRVLAAKAIVPLITANVFVNYLGELFQQLAFIQSSNLAHGLTLQIAHLLSNSSILNDDQSSVLVCHLETWVSIALQYLHTFRCNPVREALLQILELVVGSWFSCLPTSIWVSVRKILIEDILFPEEGQGELFVSLGQSILQVRAARLLLYMLIHGQDQNSKVIIQRLLTHCHSEVVLETLNALQRLQKDKIERELPDAIIPNVIGVAGHWMDQLPMDSIVVFDSLLQNDNKVGQALTTLVNCNNDMLGRLALYILSSISTSSWCFSVDMTQLLNGCRSSHEGTSSAALACFSSLLKHFMDNNLDVPSISEDFWKLLSVCSSEEKSTVSRLSVIDFLLQHRLILERQYNFLPDNVVCELWLCAISLSCDDNSEVRSRAALLCQTHMPLVPQKTLERLVDNFMAVFKSSPACSLATLLALAVGPLPDPSEFETDEERVFDKGEANMFVEFDQLTELVCLHIASHVSGGTCLATAQWNWIWVTIGGTDSYHISSADSFFKAVEQYCIQGLTESDLLYPPSVIRSLNRLSKVELAYCGLTKVKHNDCLPFNASRLLGLEQTHPYK